MPAYNLDLRAACRSAQFIQRCGIGGIRVRKDNGKVARAAVVKVHTALRVVNAAQYSAADYGVLSGRRLRKAVPAAAWQHRASGRTGNHGTALPRQHFPEQQSRVAEFLRADYLNCARSGDLPGKARAKTAALREETVRVTPEPRVVY